MSEKITVTDVICPNCFQIPPGVTLFNPVTDRYGRTTRSYFGWCIECHQGFEVVQYQQAGRWFIHKYRFWHAAMPEGLNVPDWWNKVNELPDPPVVLTGPCGEYDQAIKEKQIKTVDLLLKIQGVLKSTCQAVGNLIRATQDQ
jgi:hypothetical protein